ncbi:hypothetical protein Scep_027419 [Stephania cephalantha]|uniref:Uncharacterized protein n=1 Tax=Stephania cephalantha TaxID=152367 RepID=A0AAP0ECI0_9MAGN
MLGTVFMPPKWSLGYHQCRYSYESEERVLEDMFPNPKALVNELHLNGFKAIWMLDLGIKHEEGFFVYDSGSKRDVWIQNVDGKPFVGKFKFPLIFPSTLEVSNLISASEEQYYKIRLGDAEDCLEKEKERVYQYLHSSSEENDDDRLLLYVLCKTVIGLHDKHLGYVTKYFKNNIFFREALDGAFNVFCNENVGNISSAKMLAAYCHDILKRGREELVIETVKENNKDTIKGGIRYLEAKQALLLAYSEVICFFQTAPKETVDDEAVYYKVAGDCPKGCVYSLRSLWRKKRRYVDPDASTSQVLAQRGMGNFMILRSTDMAMTSAGMRDPRSSSPESLGARGRHNGGHGMYD